MRLFLNRIILLALFICLPFSIQAAEKRMLRDDIIIQKADGETFVFNVEMALTPQEQARGLMYRESLPENEGMLFLFPGLGQRPFWMKNTLIPLDLLFLDMDGTILHIHHMAKPQDLTRITSEEPARAVLEINGGLSGKFGIERGDKVLHSIFRNNMLAQ